MLSYNYPHTARVKSLREVAWRAHAAEMLTRSTVKGSLDLMRIGKKEIEANPDGIDDGDAVEAARLAV